MRTILVVKVTMWYLNRAFKQEERLLPYNTVGTKRYVLFLSLSLYLSHTHSHTHTHTVRYQFHQENVTKETNERIQENQKMGRVYKKATSRKVREREERSFSEKEQVSGEKVLAKVQIG